MPKSLDILVAVATVMAVLSLAVTALTQLCVQALGLRTRYLRMALADLFSELGWTFRGDGGRALAEQITGTGGAAREAIAREELVAELLKLVGDACNPASSAGEIHGVFDAVMGRATARFTRAARRAVVVSAIMIAAAAPLDTFELLQLRTGASWPGIAVSALLLSLGAPFWFHLLQDLIRLRSAGASQEKVERKPRDSSLTG